MCAAQCLVCLALAALLRLPGVPGPAVSECAFSYAVRGDGYLWVDVRLGERSARGILDTGAALTWVSPQTWAELGGPRVAKGAPGEPPSLRAAVRLGTLARQERLHLLSGPKAPPVVLGLSFLAGLADAPQPGAGPALLVFDYRGGRLTIDARPRRGPYRGVAGSTKLPLRYDAGLGLWAVTLAVNGKGLREFVIDTGSPVVYVPPEWWEQETPGWTRRRAILEAGGRRLRTPVYANRHEGHYSSVAALGNAFLREYRVVLDLRHGALWLEPPGPQAGAR